MNSEAWSSLIRTVLKVFGAYWLGKTGYDPSILDSFLSLAPIGAGTYLSYKAHK